MSYKVCYYNWTAFVKHPEYRELVCDRLNDAIAMMVSEANRLIEKLDDGLRADIVKMSDVESGAYEHQILVDVENEKGRKEGTTYIWLEETPASRFEF